MAQAPETSHQAMVAVLVTCGDDDVMIDDSYCLTAGYFPTELTLIP
jgi:hypothetical protein